MELQANLHIDTSQVIGEVHDHLYGANIEHIGETIYQGAWAEMLRVRKFAEHDRAYVGLNEGLNHQNPGFGIAALRTPRFSVPPVALDEPVWKTPTTLVMELFTRHRGPVSVASMLCAADHLVENSQQRPDAVVIEQRVWRASDDSLTLPPHSFTMLQMSAR